LLKPGWLFSRYRVKIYYVQGIVRLKWRMTVAALAIAAAGLITQRAQTQQVSATVGNKATAGNKYVDPARCEPCHTGIANSFRKTGMGRSFHRLEPGNSVEDFTPGKPFYHEASDCYFAMIERGGKYYQRRWQKGFDGRETNVDEKQVDFVMGSGNHVRAYLHLTSRNTLQQLPLGWYAEKGGYWAMSPGFDRPDFPGSTRVVTYECMFCHNAYPAIPRGHEEVGARAEFLQPIPLGIDCQRCHGPGERHIETAARAGAKVEEIRAAIVNPKRLNSDRELEVCMQCHLETTTAPLPHAIRRLDRGPFSYVPGQPLGDFRLTFDRAEGMGDGFELAYGAYRMRKSQCFLKSDGKFRCTTCHDPHDIPRGEAATVRYNAICQGCHATALERTVASGAHVDAANCVSCHMPKRRTDDAVHVVMTDHFIQRRRPAGDLLADKPEVRESPAAAYRGEVVPYYPAKLAASDQEASLYLALAQIVEWSNLKNGLPRLESLIEKYRPRRADYYADLAEGLSTAGEPAKAMPYFEEAVRHAPGSAIILRKLGSAQMESGQLAKAEATLRRVTALAPDDDGAWGMLGQVLWRENRNAAAKAAFERAINFDAELPQWHDSLGSLLLAEGDGAAAEKEFREAVRIQPGNAKVQQNLASVLASRGALANQIAEARYHFEQSIRLKPDYAEARLNYARMLALIQETGEAEKQVQAAIAADAGMAGAHQLLGALLATRGDLEGAKRELQTAVRLQPDLWRAHFELGVVLGRARDYAGAEEHLKLAAQGTDPDAKASALQLLQRLGR
jgi:predicted CXXCH cytochrome family protein